MATHTMVESVSSDDGEAILAAAAALRPVIRAHQEEIERERRIPPTLIEHLRAAGLYRMMVPQELGGAQLDLLTCFRAIELASEGDGSVGWNIATSSAQALTVLSLPDAGVREIFANGPDVPLAGTLGRAGGRGVAVNGGYVVTGRWSFGSGCQASAWMNGGFEIFDGPEPRRLPDGTTARARGFFKSTECKIVDTWRVTGLRGTGSHDWAVHEVFVPSERTSPHPGSNTNLWSRWPGTLYQMPASMFIGPHFGPVATGIARAAIDALAEIAGSKTPYTQAGLLRDQMQVQEWVGRAEVLLGSARAYREAVVSEMWSTVAAGHPVTVEQTARSRMAGSYAADCAMQATDLMYRAGGTTSIEWGQRLERCWRDMHVVGQNFALLPEFYVLGGKALLGLPPGPKLS
jgi:alkylation response protein AidB-like acyl-CoA dehydrogenase